MTESTNNENPFLKPWRRFLGTDGYIWETKFIPKHLCDYSKAWCYKTFTPLYDDDVRLCVPRQRGYVPRYGTKVRFKDEGEFGYTGYYVDNPRAVWAFRHRVILFERITNEELVKLIRRANAAAINAKHTNHMSEDEALDVAFAVLLGKEG